MRKKKKRADKRYENIVYVYVAVYFVVKVLSMQDFYDEVFRHMTKKDFSLQSHLDYDRGTYNHHVTFSVYPIVPSTSTCHYGLVRTRRKQTTSHPSPLRRITSHSLRSGPRHSSLARSSPPSCSHRRCSPFFSHHPSCNKSPSFSSFPPLPHPSFTLI